MWKLLPRTGRGASGYPQRECFFCCTTSVILPPYKPDGPSRDASQAHTAQPPSSIASSSTSAISTGTPTNWFCSSCHCQNVASEDGTPVEQYTRPMWDEAWNRDRSQLMRHTRPQASTEGKPSAVSSPGRSIFISPVIAKNGTFTFCHTCQTNQVLTLNMLADYLPSEDDPDYQQKLGLLSEYEASIASRYPPVCSDCAPKVQERIAERDQFARSWSLGRWLDLKKKASNLDLGDVTHPTSPVLKPSPVSMAAGSDVQSHVQRTPSLRARFQVDKGSPFAMALFAIVNLSIWAFYLATTLKPLSSIVRIRAAADRAQIKPTWLLVSTAILFLLWRLLIVISQMDPLKRSISQARARQIRVETKGLALWRSTQGVILALRLMLVLTIALGTSTPGRFTNVLAWMEASSGRGRVELLRLTALTLLISEAALTMLAAANLGVQEPAPLQLVSRPMLADKHPTKLARPDGIPLLTSLSLDDRAALSSSTFSRLDSQGMSVGTTQDDDVNARIPPPRRDADGDAIMEDAATCSARRASASSEDDWDQGSPQIPPAPLSAWGSQWSTTMKSKAHNRASVPSASAAHRLRQASTYTDFQLGPQRFWEPQKPTGLEDVFGRAVSLNDRPQQDQAERQGDASAKWSKWLGFS